MRVWRLCSANWSNTREGRDRIFITFLSKNGYGDFTVDTQVTAVSNSTNPTGLGNGTIGELQITSLAVRNNSSGTKTLNVLLGDTGFTFPGVPGDQMTLRSSIGGTFLQGSLGGDTFTFQSYADVSNAQFGTGITTGPQTFTARSPLPPLTTVRAGARPRTGGAPRRRRT